MSNLHNKEFEKGVVWVEKGLDGNAHQRRAPGRSQDLTTSLR